MCYIKLGSKCNISSIKNSIVKYNKLLIISAEGEQMLIQCKNLDNLKYFLRGIHTTSQITLHFYTTDTYSKKQCVAVACFGEPISLLFTAVWL